MIKVPMHPEYKQEYKSSPASCECPARTFRPAMPCKHMQADQALTEQYQTSILAQWSKPPAKAPRSLEAIASDLQRLIDRGRIPEGAKPFVKLSHTISTRDGLVDVYRVDRRALAIRLRQIRTQKFMGNQYQEAV